MDFRPPRADLRMGEGLRGELSGVLGPVVATAEALRMAKGRTLATVGDVVTNSFLHDGVVPKLSIVDGVTLRGDEVPLVKAGLFTRSVRLKNPRGLIAKEAWVGIADAYSAQGTTLVRVDGEEDLLAIPCIVLAPEGSLVMYGVPGEGIGVNEASRTNKLKCIEILGSMEEC